jgi:hypothetical protein
VQQDGVLCAELTRELTPELMSIGRGQIARPRHLSEARDVAAIANEGLREPGV